MRGKVKGIRDKIRREDKELSLSIVHPRFFVENRLSSDHRHSTDDIPPFLLLARQTEFYSTRVPILSTSRAAFPRGNVQICIISPRVHRKDRFLRHKRFTSVFYTDMMLFLYLPLNSIQDPLIILRLKDYFVAKREILNFLYVYYNFIRDVK